MVYQFSAKQYGPFLILLLVLGILFFVGNSPANDTVHHRVNLNIFSNELLPDLVPLPARDLKVAKSGGKMFLYFSTTYYNQGAGTLELRADPATAGIREDIERDVVQRIYDKEGNFRDVEVGTFLWHQEHLHYHFTDFITYDLEPVDAPKDTRLSGNLVKSTFCLRDVSRVNLELPNSVEDAKYKICGKELQGVSVGWGDTYYWDYPDQSLDITGLASGTYRLIFVANPDNHLVESRYNNNTSSVLFRLDAENTSVEILKETPSNAPEVEHVYLEQPFGIGPAVPKETHDEESAASIVAENLEIPWDIAFLPEGGMLVTERPGKMLLIDANGGRQIITLPGNVAQRGESGLLGIELHPNFKTNHFLYLYLSAPGANGQTMNRVLRYKFENNELSEEKIIIENIPGATYHDGGRMEFGPDGLLYITTGDATVGANAQDKNSLSGKILRLRDDGSIPVRNPFNNAVYSYGHRNPQGLAWDSAGRLWETEHGPTGEKGQCCHDEINLIQAGANYGWPNAIGDSVASGVTSPALNSETDTWAPASAAIIGNRLFFGGLKGEALYEATLSGGSVISLKEHLKGEYGRIRTVRAGPDGYLYLTTSNRDGRGSGKAGDDKIIRVNPAML